MVTDKTFDSDEINSLKGQWDAVVRLEHTLLMAPFMADLDRCCESFNTLDDPSLMIFNLFDRLSASNKVNYVNLQVLIMITRFNN